MDLMNENISPHQSFVCSVVTVHFDMTLHDIKGALLSDRDVTIQYAHICISWYMRHDTNIMILTTI